MNIPCEPDPNGDVVLSCCYRDSVITKSFRVSSKVLQLASPVFVRMLGSSFKEGQELLQAKCVKIHLKDDDAYLMTLILNVLHYKADTQFYGLDAEDLAQLAIHCDKYDCTRALGPWVWAYFDKMFETDQTVMDIGFFLLAFYMFNDSQRFSNFSKKAIEDMTPDSSGQWRKDDTLTLLPTKISNVMIVRIKQALKSLINELQSTESLLRESSKYYVTSHLNCILCGRTLPEQAKRCHPCRNTILLPRHCTSETRIAEYFAVLRKAELWPTTNPFDACSISDVVCRFTSAKAYLKHNCAAEKKCPLLTNFEALLWRVSQVQSCITGLCLPCARQDKWEDNTTCCHEREKMHQWNYRKHLSSFLVK